MPGCRALNDTEIEEIKQQFVRQRDRCFFVVANRTGLRVSELLSLKVKHVYKFDKIVDALKLTKDQVKGKRVGTEIVLHSDAKAEIQTLLDELPEIDPEHYLFKSRKGKNRPISRVQAWYILKGITNEMELQGKIATHSCRKTFAWKFYKKSGHDLRSTQKALRHEFIETTIKYLDPDQKDVDKTILEMT